MNKKPIRGYILIAFVFIIYGVATIPFPKTVVFWIAFFFSVLSVLVQVYTVNIVMKNQALIKDRVYDFPMIRVSTLYLIIQLSASLLIMGFSAKIPVFGVVLIEMIILATAVVGFFAVEAVRKEVIRQDAQMEKELLKMKELQERINLLISQCGEGQIKEILQKLAEELRYSNPISKNTSEDIEDEIIALFTDIESAALDEDMENIVGMCDRMKGLLRERDRICKYGK